MKVDSVSLYFRKNLTVNVSVSLMMQEVATSLEVQQHSFVLFHNYRKVEKFEF